MKEMNTKIAKEGFGASQDIAQYTDYAAQMRAELVNNTTFRSFCVIPDIVAIDIHLKHRIDVHDDAQMGNPATTKKLQRIMRQEYPHLLTGGISNKFSLGI